MHSINKDGKLVGVNDRWLKEFGYKRQDVLGRKSTEFLSEESRELANRVLPDFWRRGLVRSVGFRFLRKNGEPFDVLLDAEVSPLDSEECGTIAVLRDSADPMQYELASTIIRALQHIRVVERELHYPEGAEHVRELSHVTRRDRAVVAAGAQPTHEALGSFLEMGQDIVHNLRAWVAVLEEGQGASLERQEELTGVVRRIESHLRELLDANNMAHRRD